MDGFTEGQVPEQTGKTALITGANTGLGFETARVLAAKGARVLLACRSVDKGEAAKARILELSPEADLEVVELDLGDLASVRAAADVVKGEPRLDLLINNAGIMMCPRSETVDGFETQIGVNHLGHFALTGLLLEKLEETAQSQGDARVVITSSSGHKMGKIEFDDFKAERSYSKTKRYGMSKLANLLHAYELDRRLRARGMKTRAVAVHPGVSQTELGRHMPSWLLWLFGPLMNWMTSQPAEGAWSTLMGATDEVESGAYYGPGGSREMKGPAQRVDSNDASKDLEVAAQLWALSIEKTGVDPAV